MSQLCGWSFSSLSIRDIDLGIGGREGMRARIVVLAQIG